MAASPSSKLNLVVVSGEDIRQHSARVYFTHYVKLGNYAEPLLALMRKHNISKVAFDGVVLFEEAIRDMRRVLVSSKDFETFNGLLFQQLMQDARVEVYDEARQIASQHAVNLLELLNEEAPDVDARVELYDAVVAMIKRAAWVVESTLPSEVKRDLGTERKMFDDPTLRFFVFHEGHRTHYVVANTLAFAKMVSKHADSLRSTREQDAAHLAATYVRLMRGRATFQFPKPWDEDLTKNVKELRALMCTKILRFPSVL